MKKWLWFLVPLGAIVFGVLAGGLWLKWHDAETRASALQVQKDSILEVRRQELAAAEVSRLAEVAEHARLRGQLEAANRRSAVRDSVLRLTTGRLDSALHAVIPPDLTPMLDSLIGSYEGRLAGKDSTIANLNLDLRNALSDQAKCDLAAVDLRKNADEAFASRDVWQKRAQPGFWKKVAQGLPWAAAGAGTVVVLGVVAKLVPDP